MGDKNLDNLSGPSKISPRSRRKRKAPTSSTIEIEQKTPAFVMNTICDYTAPIVYLDSDKAMYVGDQPGPSKPKRRTLLLDVTARQMENRRLDEWQMDAAMIATMSPVELEVFDRVMDVFEDADGEHVVEMINDASIKVADDAAHVIERILTDGYRRRAVVRANRAIANRRALLLDDAQLDIADLLRETPDPATTFTDETKVMSAAYCEHALIYLQNEFRTYTRQVIEHVLQAHGHRLIPTERQLRGATRAPQADSNYRGDHVREHYRREQERHLEALRLNLNANNERLLEMFRNQPNPVDRARHLGERLEGIDYLGRHILDDARPRVDWPAQIDEQFFRELQYLRNREAVDAHIVAETERYTTAQREGAVVACPICFEENIPETHTVDCKSRADDTHGHVLCRACFTQHAKTQINEQGQVDMVTCAQPDCNREYTMEQLGEVLPRAAITRLAARREASQLRKAGIDNIVECPFCDYFVEMVDRCNEMVFVCRNPLCQRRSCITCTTYTPMNELHGDVARRAGNEAKLQIKLENPEAAAVVRDVNLNTLVDDQPNVGQRPRGYADMFPVGRYAVGYRGPYAIADHDARLRLIEQQVERDRTILEIQRNSTAVRRARNRHAADHTDRYVAQLQPLPALGFVPTAVVRRPPAYHGGLYYGGFDAAANMRTRASEYWRLESAIQRVGESKSTAAQRRESDLANADMNVARNAAGITEDEARAIEKDEEKKAMRKVDEKKATNAPGTSTVAPERQGGQALSAQQSNKLIKMVDKLHKAAFALRRAHRDNQKTGGKLLTVTRLLGDRDAAQRVNNEYRRELLEAHVDQDAIDEIYNTAYERENHEFRAAAVHATLDEQVKEVLRFDDARPVTGAAGWQHQLTAPRAVEGDDDDVLAIE